MTKDEKTRIREMAANGASYLMIAETLRLPKEAVRSFCRYHGLAQSSQEDASVRFCLFCGKQVSTLPHKKERKFCGDACRLAWWNSHPEKVTRRALHTLVCRNCGVSFQSKNPSQKYCCRSCYGIAQRKERDNGLGRTAQNRAVQRDDVNGQKDA